MLLGEHCRTSTRPELNPRCNPRTLLPRSFQIPARAQQRWPASLPANPQHQRLNPQTTSALGQFIY